MTGQKKWLALSPKEKTELVTQVLGASTDQTFELMEVNRGYEITVAPKRPLSVGEEGHLLMELERHLRRTLQAPIEVYYRQRLDENKLRRTLQRQMEWDQRRAEMKTLAEEQDGGSPRPPQ